MDILFTSLHQIDYINEKIVDVEITKKSSDLKDYVLNLIHEIRTSNNRRKFNFERETTEVRMSINFFLQEKFNEASRMNIERLFSIEKQTQASIAQLTEIQKGSLFQAFLANESSKMVVISKADHNEYLDEIDFTTHKGLPLKKKIYKAFVAEIDNKNQIEKVYVFDTNPTMSKYWWKDYLELVEFYTDSENTKRSMELIDRRIFNSIKKKYPADHTILRNSMVGYFRSKEDFEVSEFVNSIFKSYEPIDKNLQIEKLIETLESLPESGKFDTRFKIEKDEIKKRMIINKIPLTERIELILKDHISNLGNTIQADKDLDGKKFVKVYSDYGYERFNLEKKNENLKDN